VTSSSTDGSAVMHTEGEKCPLSHLNITVIRSLLTTINKAVWVLFMLMFS
jgi:hypothetical protein